jgi:predicted transcriptional regulator
MIARPSQRYYPVVDYNGVLRGVLDLEDLKGAGGDFLNSKAVDFARRDFVMADADGGVEENLKVLLVRDAVLVTHAGKLVGMVTQDDFARAAAFYNLANRSA